MHNTKKWLLALRHPPTLKTAKHSSLIKTRYSIVSGMITGSLILALAFADSAYASIPKGYMIGDIFKTDIKATSIDKPKHPIKISDAVKQGKVNVFGICHMFCAPCDAITKTLKGGVGSLNSYDVTFIEQLLKVGLTPNEISDFSTTYFGIDLMSLPPSEIPTAAENLRGLYEGFLGEPIFGGDFTNSNAYGNKVHEVSLIVGLDDGPGAILPSSRFQALSYKANNIDAPPDMILHNNNTIGDGPVNQLRRDMVAEYGFPTSIVTDKHGRIFGILIGATLRPGMQSGNLNDNRMDTYMDYLIKELIKPTPMTQALLMEDIEWNIVFITNNSGGAFSPANATSMVSKLTEAKQLITAGKRDKAAEKLEAYWKQLSALFGEPAYIDPSQMLGAGGSGTSKAFLTTNRDIEYLKKGKK